LLYCHNEGIIHNDIQIRHVLIDSHFDAKLKGFELAVLSTSSCKISSLVPFTSAPEVLKTGIVSKKSDVFSFGLLMWELGHNGHRKPHDKSNLSLLQLVDRIISGVTPDIPEEWPLAYRVVIQLCLLTDPQSRPDMAVIQKEIEQAKKDFHSIPRSGLHLDFNTSVRSSSEGRSKTVGYRIHAPLLDSSEDLDVKPKD